MRCSVCDTRQTAFTSTSDGTFCPVETSCFTTDSQDLDYTSDQALSEMVDQQRSVLSGFSCQSVSSDLHPVFGHQ